jgi:hypothetical protein
MEVKKGRGLHAEIILLNYILTNMNMNGFSNYTVLQSWRAESDSAGVYSSLLSSKRVNHIVSSRPRSGSFSGSG